MNLNPHFRILFQKLNCLPCQFQGHTAVVRIYTKEPAIIMEVWRKDIKFLSRPLRVIIMHFQAFLQLQNPGLIPLQFKWYF